MVNKTVCIRLVKCKTRRTKQKSHICDLEHDSTTYQVIKYLNKSEKGTLLINRICIEKWEKFYKALWINKNDTSTGWLEVMKTLTLSHRRSTKSWKQN